MNNKNRSEELIIRRAQLSDLNDIMPVFACARRLWLRPVILHNGLMVILNLPL